MMLAYRVYVLQNPAGKFYVGVSAGVDRRLAEHNAGRSRWTKKKVSGILFGKANRFR
jgi:predicted GIY-YIG superfamily endonuclease